LKADGKTRCGFAANTFYDKKVYCGQHYKKVPGAPQGVNGDFPLTEKGPYLLSKKREEDAKPKKPAAVTKKSDEEHDHSEHEEDVKPAKKAVKKVVKKESDEEIEEEHEAEACCTKPTAKKIGAKCFVLKKDKEVCGKDAQYKCKHGSSCGIHWALVKQHAAAGAKSRKKNEIADDEQCECDTKAKSRCTRRAFGKNKDGKKACNSHGGPKKEDTAAGGTGKGAVSSAPSGPFAGADFLTLMVRMFEWRQQHMLDVEHGEDDTCGHCDALRWFIDLTKLREAGSKLPTTDQIMNAIIAIEETPNGENFAEIHSNCALYYLGEIFAGPKGVDDGQIKWIYALFARMAKQKGELGAQISVLWKEISTELSVEAEEEDETPKGSSTAGAALLSSRTANMAAMAAALAKKKKDALEKAEGETKVVADEENEEGDEKATEVAEAMEQDDEEEKIDL
jgi:hypothetical protein